MKLSEIAGQKEYHYGHMTIGECIDVAAEAGMSVGEVILIETSDVSGKNRKEIAENMEEAFAHNLQAAEIGAKEGESFLLGAVGQDLTKEGAPMIIEDAFVNKVVAYTLAAQVGNHSIGLRPCAGTGDSCPYTGFVKAMKEDYNDIDLMARVMAVILKVGGEFRIGKTTTGCNMEGFGAGAAAAAAAFVELEGGTPAQMETAMTLALSPTISVPCTPRVLVPGLCATHIGGGILIARLASRLAMYTTIPSNVPIDVMIAMAAQCHLASAKHIVPITIEYMEPFFMHNDKVEEYISSEVKNTEQERQQTLMRKAIQESQRLADKANPITAPFGEAVVGGSSLGVGSPTNCARIAHFLAKGEVKKVKIELYAEMFARRAINVPGILMAAIDGHSTSNVTAYKNSMDTAREKGVEVEILEIPEHSVQRVTIEATEGDSMVESINSAGARLILKDAKPSLKRAKEIAKELGIVIIE